MKTYLPVQPLTRHITVGVDWLTITANTNERKEALLKRFLRSKEALILFGELPETWKWHGYAGVKIGQFRWGTRSDSDILILSGADAQAYWSMFAPLATNCTRIDLAVTARTTQCYPRLLQSYIDWLRENGSRLLSKTVKLERGDGRGQTLYVNSRDSDQFGRIYDKGAEDNQPFEIHRLWRYEVEFKRDRAALVLEQLLSAACKDAWPQNICSTVYQWFDSRDLPPIWGKTAVRPINLELSATVTSTSQKLHWLTVQVKPTVQALLTVGMEKEIVHALGLDKDPG